MSDFPKFVEFREEGPREGFQIEKKIYPIEERVELIDMLSETGLKRIQVGSFVNTQKVPQMADTAELFKRIRRVHGVRYTSLWLNDKGFRKALAAPQVDIDPRLLFYPSDTFSRKNNDASSMEMREKQREWVNLYKQEGYTVDTAYVMTAFGCNFEGPIPQDRVLDDFRFVLDLCAEENIPLPILVVADTMGLGIANIYAALSMGVDMFESSVAGLGGCPFAGHGHARAAGNVCTEDAVFLCHELGIATGVDLDKLIAASVYAEKIIGSPLMGRVMHSGGLDKYRKV
jgi:hydroxymethylglutaryl-CoA lyase